MDKGGPSKEGLLEESSLPTIVQPVSVSLQGRLEDTSNVKTFVGTWRYINGDISSNSFCFKYQRTLNPAPIPPWQYALTTGASTATVLELWDPTSAISDINKASSASASASTDDDGPAKVLDSAASSSVSSSVSTTSTTATADTNTAIFSHASPNTALAKVSTVSTLGITAKEKHPESMEAIVRQDNPADLTDWSGSWEGFFILRRNGRDTEVRERFILHPSSKEERFQDKTLKVVGGGTNTYGRFQLYGKLNTETKELECERSYVQMPRKRRKRAAQPLKNAASRSSQRYREVCVLDLNALDCNHLT